jgi:hypothetical protein
MKSSHFYMTISLMRACVVLVAVIIGIGSTAQAQFDLGVEQTLLMDLLRDGKYKQALSEARRIEKVVKPPKKNAVPGPATRVYIELLIYRGTIERRMGSLDDADKTLTEAFKQLSDPGFQQFINWSTPKSENERDAYFLSVEMPYLQMIDNGTEVLLERIRNSHERLQLRQSKPANPPKETPTSTSAATGSEESTADAAADIDERGKIVGWFRQVDELIRLSQATRSSLRSKIPTAGVGDENTPSRSPLARMLLSQARPNRYVGMRYLEASLLPWTLSFDTDTPVTDDEPKRAGRRPANDASQEPTDETPAERQRQATSQRMRAKAYLEKAEELAEAAMKPAIEGLEQTRSPAAVDGAGEPAASLEPNNAEKEAARIRAEILVPLARVALLGGDLDKARDCIDRAVTGLQESEVPDHPELARPLIISAEVAFAESRRSLAAQDAITAHDKARLAADALHDAQRLLKSDESEFDPAAPLHLVLANQLALVKSFEKSSSQTAAANSAADAAARRALAALKTVPKPATSMTPPVAPAVSPAQPAGAKPQTPAPPAPAGGAQPGVPKRPAPPVPAKTPS